MAVSYTADIRPLFREGDIECMKPAGVHLDDAAWMSVPANAQHVLHAVSSAKMPPDAPWPKERVAALAGMDQRRLSRVDTALIAVVVSVLWIVVADARDAP